MRDHKEIHNSYKLFTSKSRSKSEIKDYKYKYIQYMKQSLSLVHHIQYKENVQKMTFLKVTVFFKLYKNFIYRHHHIYYCRSFILYTSKQHV